MPVSNFFFFKDPGFLNRNVLVGGLDQFAGRRAFETDDFDAAAVHLQVVNQRNVVAVAGDESHAVEFLGHGHGVDGQANFPRAFGGAGRAAVGVGADFQFLDLEFVTEAAERFVEAGLIDVGFLNDVGDGADELGGVPVISPQQAAVIDLALVQQLGRIKHVLDIDEYSQPLREGARDKRGLRRRCRVNAHACDSLLAWLYISTLIHGK